MIGCIYAAIWHFKGAAQRGTLYTERLTSVWDEVLAYMEESTVGYTVIGTVDTKDPEEYLAVAPVSSNKISPIYWGSRLAVLDAYLTGPEHVDQVREYLRQKFPNAANKYNLDAAKVEGLQRTVYILKTIYPMVLAAALVIGGFLAALAIVQSAKEAAILRILGNHPAADPGHALQRADCAGGSRTPAGSGSASHLERGAASGHLPAACPVQRPVPDHRGRGGHRLRRARDPKKRSGTAPDQRINHFL
jgi:hypothetical protein